VPRPIFDKKSIEEVIQKVVSPMADLMAWAGGSVWNFEFRRHGMVREIGPDLIDRYAIVDITVTES